MYSTESQNYFPWWKLSQCLAHGLSLICQLTPTWCIRIIQAKKSYLLDLSPFMVIRVDVVSLETKDWGPLFLCRICLCSWYRERIIAVKAKEVWEDPFWHWGENNIISYPTSAAVSYHVPYPQKESVALSWNGNERGMKFMPKSLWI